MDLAGKRVLLFTDGGVAPALNATLCGAISALREAGAKILGGINGWASLVRDVPIIDLESINTDLVQGIGGTFLRTSRTNPFKEMGGIAKLREKMRKLEIDFIIAIGGDDTLGAAFRAWRELGLPIVGIPKTIDNDLSATYFTPGFPTAAANLASFTAAIKRTAYATGKIYIVESLGGKAGWLPAASSFGGADIIVPPERKINLNHLLMAIEDVYRERGSVVIVISHTANLGEKIRSEYHGREDQYGIQRGFLISLGLRKIIEGVISGVEVKVLFPGNFSSAANPINLDREQAVKLGAKAVELLAQEKFGEMATIEMPVEGIFHISSVPLSEAVGVYRNLEDGEYFDFGNYRPTPCFEKYLENILGREKIFSPEYKAFLESLETRKIY